MKPAIQEYSDALQANINASRNEMTAKEVKRKAYYRLIRAKDALRMVERELFEDIEANRK